MTTSMIYKTMAQSARVAIRRYPFLTTLAGAVGVHTAVTASELSIAKIASEARKTQLMMEQKMLNTKYAMELSPSTFKERAELRRQELNRIFSGKRKKKGEHLSKESIVIAFHNLHDLEHFPMGRPSNVIPPELIRRVAAQKK